MLNPLRALFAAEFMRRIGFHARGSRPGWIGTSSHPVRTMLLTWKYTLPPFLVPFVFVLAREGERLLLQGDLATIAIATVSAAVGVAGLAVATGAWVLGPAGLPERVLSGVGGLAMMFTMPISIAVGGALMTIGFVIHFVGRRRRHDAEAAA